MGQYFSNEKLPSNLKKINVNISLKSFSFLTDNGVFSKDDLDFGSELLIEAILKEKVSGKGLDVGCGYGPMGIIINKILGCEMTLTDVNKRALHLCEKNFEINSCKNISALESSCYSELDESKVYNFIITNPPIRAGKKIVYEIIMEARKYLTSDGFLYIVIRKEQGAKTMIRDLGEFYLVEILNKEKGFFILKCKPKD